MPLAARSLRNTREDDAGAAPGDQSRRRRTVIRPAASIWATLFDNLRALPDYRDLLLTLSAHRINVRYRQTALGVLWAVLQPLLMMVIFTGVFSVLARIPSEGVPYALFAYTALLPWTFFSTALTNATGSLVGHSQLITKVYFPREILPVTYVIAAVFDFAIGCVVLAGLMVWFDVELTVHVWYLVPIVLVLIGWILAVSLVAAAAQVRWRDVGVAMPLIVQVWMFASPVIYPLGVVPDAWRSWYLLNPMAGIINGFRQALLHGVAPDAEPLRYSAVVTAVALPIAYVIFKRAERTMADIV